MAKNDNPTPTLKPQQRRAIAALLIEKDTRAAAAVCSVSETQLRRWLAMPLFKAELQAASSAAIDKAILRLSALTGQAVDVLKEIMLDPETSSGTRLQAVNIHLARLLDLRGLVNIESRIAALEAAQHENKS